MSVMHSACCDAQVLSSSAVIAVILILVRAVVCERRHQRLFQSPVSMQLSRALHWCCPAHLGVSQDDVMSTGVLGSNASIQLGGKDIELVAQLTDGDNLW
jgi:hypothetical protein